MRRSFCDKVEVIGRRSSQSTNHMSCTTTVFIHHSIKPLVLSKTFNGMALASGRLGGLLGSEPAHLTGSAAQQWEEAACLYQLLIEAESLLEQHALSKKERTPIAK